MRTWTAAILAILCLPQEARANFRLQLPHIELPREIQGPVKDAGHALEDGRALRTVGHALQRAQDVVRVPAEGAVQDALRATGTAAADSLTGSLPKDLSDTLKHVRADEVVDTIGAVSPKVVDMLRTSDAQRYVEALREADPENIEDAMAALGLWRWWRTNWQWPLLASLAVLLALVGAWWAFCRLRRKRRKQRHLDVELPDAEESFL